MKGMHSIGTVGVVNQVVGSNWPRPAYSLHVTGLCRFRLLSFVQKEPFMVAKLSQLDRYPGIEAEEY